MVEQIGHDTEEDLRAQFDLAIRDRGCEMRFAASRRASQQQPGWGFLGVHAAFFERLGQHSPGRLGQGRAPGWQERLERSIGQRTEVAPPRQAIADFSLTARARNRPPKVGVAERHVAAHKAVILADRAHGLWVWLQRTRTGMVIRAGVDDRAMLAAAGINVARVKITDPSFLNWPGIIQAAPGNIIPDFPVINKSFNFSYSGNDR